MVRKTISGGAATRLSLVGFALMCLGSPLSAGAQDGVRLVDAAPMSVSAMTTGEQIVLEDFSGPLKFAGHDLTFKNFTGILGYASDVAYVSVIDGSVKASSTKAKRGHILMIPPYGAEPGVARFDAERLAAGWSPAVRDARPNAYQRLNSLASAQGRRLFFGRFERTRFNVASSGLGAEELSKRSYIGAATVRDIRFSGETDPTRVEQTVVETFLSALIRKDAAAAAALMDPSPYGTGNLSASGQKARLGMAEALIAQQDWTHAVSGAKATRIEGTNSWELNSGGGRFVITLRPLGDFTYVQTIKKEG